LYFVTDEIAAAIHALDNLFQPLNPQRSLEATVMLASLRAHPRPGVSSNDVGQERARARELFDRVNKEFDDSRTDVVKYSSRIVSGLADDIELHVEMARLWQDENLEKMGRALKEALRISEAQGQVDPRIFNNLGVMRHVEGNLSEARTLYENALTSAFSLNTDIGESMSTSILYNLARVYEDSGEETMANDAYDKLLSRHPEYVDGR
jgi:RNA polymerase-associated protein CTR9